MSTIKIPVIKAKQPMSVVYIGKMDALKLLSMSSVDRRHINEDDEAFGVQRPLRPEKVNEIKRYLKTPYATFPNSIIVNVKREDVVNVNDTEIELKEGEGTFTIIDGQHRLFGFEEYKGQYFELILSIFVDLDEGLQSRVFSTINSKQTKVDPSLNINLELSDKKETPTKMLVQIAQAFNIDKDSPWYQQIRMLGNQSNGMISLAAFVRPLFDLTYPEKFLIDINNTLQDWYPEFPDFKDIPVDGRRYPFWNFYVSRETSTIYKILSNYFNALKQILSDDWMNQESILNKTTGYNAMIKLLSTILPIAFDNHNLSNLFFLQMLSPLSKLSGNLSSEKYGASGYYASNKLYMDMLATLHLSK